MKKQQYMIPLVEVKTLSTVLMYLTGSASAPPDNFQGAPKRRTDVF